MIQKNQSRIYQKTLKVDFERFAVKEVRASEFINCTFFKSTFRGFKMIKQSTKSTLSDIDSNTYNPAANWEVICDGSTKMIAELSKDNPSVSNVLELTNLMSKTKGYQRLGYKGGVDFFNDHLSNYPWNKPLFMACHKVSNVSAQLGLTATLDTFKPFNALTQVSRKYLKKAISLARKMDNRPVPNAGTILEVINKNPHFLKKGKAI